MVYLMLNVYKYKIKIRKKTQNVGNIEISNLINALKREKIFVCYWNINEY